MKNVALTFTMLIIMLYCGSCGRGSRSDIQRAQMDTIPNGTISISGAFALYPLANIWAEEFHKIHPGVRFNISAGGAGKGMADALAQAVQLGMFSRDLKNEEISQGAWWLAVAIDAVLPTINAANPALEQLKLQGLSRDEFREIFITKEITDWSEVVDSPVKIPISLYTRSDAAGAAAVWAQYLGAEGQEALQGIGVYGDPGLADAVKNDKNGIGFNNVVYIYDLNSGKKYDGLEVVPIDLNSDNRIDESESFYDLHSEIANAIGEGIYPSPPARELFFISKGKPQDQIVASFLQWILRDGQKFVGEAGYIPLSGESINRELKKLEDIEPIAVK